MSETALVGVKDVSVEFKIRQGFIDEFIRRKKKVVRAVDNISFDIAPGEILSLVGESGSGKTTTGRALLSLVRSTAGNVYFHGGDIGLLKGKQVRDFRKKAQMIFQDPYQSLNPRFNVFEIVTEPLLFNEHKNADRAVKEEMAVKALEFAGLRPGIEYLYRYPHELSGGQRQRVSIATCFIMSPELIVADEPVSMLDASVRANILKLFVGMKDEKNAAILFITHDLSLAWLISDRIAIMYLGKIVEIGPADIIAGSCMHPYSQALTSVLAMVGEERRRPRIILKGETPSPMNIPEGCRFHPRCPAVCDLCRKEEPTLKEVQPGHSVMCHYPGKM
ncbi:MAG: ABC transporter ATP-binding protein [Clostridiales bacterium]|jgi:oligopeptide/dipeptide ABC transporter ATP-binding protein|nr:ABC transporter ATP-binding protein [Clostridiales bacterium]